MPPPPSFRLGPLVALLFAWVGLVGVRTFAFAAWHGTGSLFAHAMLDLCGLFLAAIAFVVLPLSTNDLGAIVLALGFGLPLAGVGWLLETTVSPEVSLLGAFVGLHALAAGGIAGRGVEPDGALRVRAAPLRRLRSGGPLRRSPADVVARRRALARTPHPRRLGRCGRDVASDGSSTDDGLSRLRAPEDAA
jgi:hypothetical protein